MKKFFLFFVLFSILSTFIYAETSSSSINWLSKGAADQFYCQLDKDCTLNNLFLTGNVSFLGDIINVTIINQNVTGQLDINGDLYFDNGTIENPNYIQFNTAWEDGQEEGRLQWNSEDGTLEFGLPGGNVNGQILQEMLFRTFNDEGTEISNGRPVLINGAQGNRLTVRLPDASNDGDTFAVIALATENLTVAQGGYITTTGFVRGDEEQTIDCSAGSGFLEGGQVFLGDDGDISPSPATKPNRTVFIGIVKKSHATLCEIWVNIIHIPKIYELSDVSISGEQTWDIMQWNNDTRLWTNTVTPTLNNLTLLDSLKINGFRITEQQSNENIVDNFSVIKFERNNDPMSIFGVQGGGPGQATWLAGSFMLVNRNSTILNGENTSDCQVQANQAGIELKIDCNTTDPNNPLGSGPDLLSFGDFQFSGEGWMRDTDLEWHFISRELEIRDELYNNILESIINSTITDDILTIEETQNDTLLVNINESNIFLNKIIDSIALTVGTNTTPIFNQVFYSNDSGTVALTKETSLIARTEVPDVAQILFGGNFSYGDIVGSATNNNFINGVYNRFFDDGSIYKSGFDIDVTTSTINISEGIMKVLLSQFNILNNHSTDKLAIEIHNDGEFHQHFNDFQAFDAYSTGELIGVNKYFNLVCGIAATSDNSGRMYCMAQNKPIAEYSTLAGAENDNINIVNFPNNAFIKKIYIPVVRVVIQATPGGNVIQTLSTGNMFIDLRGTVTSSGGSPPTPGITSHPDLTNLEWSVSGHTIDTTLDLSNNNIANGGQINSTEFIQGDVSLNDTYVNVDGDTMTGILNFSNKIKIRLSEPGLLKSNTTGLSDCVGDIVVSASFDGIENCDNLNSITITDTCAPFPPPGNCWDGFDNATLYLPEGISLSSGTLIQSLDSGTSVATWSVSCTGGDVNNYLSEIAFETSCKVDTAEDLFFQGEKGIISYYNSTGDFEYGIGNTEFNGEDSLGMFTSVKEGFYINKESGLVSIPNDLLILQNVNSSSIYVYNNVSINNSLGIGQAITPQYEIEVIGHGGTGTASIVSVKNEDDGAGHAGGQLSLVSSGWGEWAFSVGDPTDNGNRLFYGAGGFTTFAGYNLGIDFESAAGTSRMRILDGGNVGINQENPTEALDVVGNVTISGNLCINSSCIADWSEVNASGGGGSGFSNPAVEDLDMNIYNIILQNNSLLSSNTGGDIIFKLGGESSLSETANYVLQTPNTENVGDVYIRQASPTSNFGSTTAMNIQDHTGNFKRYGMIKFNLDGLDIGEIIDARLQIYIPANNLDAATEGYNISTHHIFDSYVWDELSVTWNTGPSAGTDYNTTESDDKNYFGGVGEPIGLQVFNVTAILKDDNTGNVSIFLFAHDVFGAPSTTDTVNFWSKESGDSNKPILNITTRITANENISNFKINKDGEDILTVNKDGDLNISGSNCLDDVCIETWSEINISGFQNPATENLNMSTFDIISNGDISGVTLSMEGGDTNTIRSANNGNINKNSLNVKSLGTNVPFGILFGAPSDLALGLGIDYGDDESLLGIDDEGGNQLILAPYDYTLAFDRDFDHPLQDDPALFIQSDTDPNTDNTQWGRLRHNKTDLIIDNGKGNIVLDPVSDIVWVGGNVSATAFVEHTTVWQRPNREATESLKNISRITLNDRKRYNYDSLPPQTRAKVPKIERYNCETLCMNCDNVDCKDVSNYQLPYQPRYDTQSNMLCNEFCDERTIMIDGIKLGGLQAVELSAIQDLIDRIEILEQKVSILEGR
jgi:hypothetical protein